MHGGHVRHGSLMGLDEGGLEIVEEGEFEGGMMGAGGVVGMGIVAGGLM